MSVITGFVLITSVSDGDDWSEGTTEDEYGNLPPGPNIRKINEWLDKNKFGQIKDSAGDACGSRHPQISHFYAGYNHFPEDDFVEFFQTLAWECPENVVLLLNPEDGPTRVFRPPFTA